MVGSSRRRDLRSVLGARLRTLSATHLRQKAIRLPYAVTGGNEFQTIVNDQSQIPGLVYDVTLEGVVASEEDRTKAAMDAQLAGTFFAFKNDLRIEPM